MTTSTTQCFPFFTPILDAVLDMKEEERRTLPFAREKEKGKKGCRKRSARNAEHLLKRVVFGRKVRAERRNQRKVYPPA